MDFYHSWVYRFILNTEWFLWVIITFVFAFNILSPIIIWLTMNSKPLPLLKRRTSDKKQK